MLPLFGDRCDGKIDKTQLVKRASIIILLVPLSMAESRNHTSMFVWIRNVMNGALLCTLLVHRT